MAKKGLAEVVCVIDKSSSLKAVDKDVVGGFNKFIKSQKDEIGQASVTTVLFDTENKYLYFGTDIQDVKRLTKKVYIPSGKTSLFDAVGNTIDKVGVRLSDTLEEERPEKVIFTIFSYGTDNSSREYSKEQVYDRVKHQTYGYKWQFIYMGANQDAAINADAIGIDKESVYCFESSSEGIRKGFDKLSEVISSVRETLK